MVIYWRSSHRAYGASTSAGPHNPWEFPIALIGQLGNAERLLHLGWVVDTVLYNGRPRTRLYKSGLILAGVLSALPGVWAVAAWLITLFIGRKLG